MIRLFLFILLILAFNSCSSYEKVPNLVFKTSKGILGQGNSYFILRYYMYRAPRGLSRFPDGGHVKIIFDKYYLMKMNTRGVTSVAEIDTSSFHKILFVSTKLALYDESVLVRFKFYREKSVDLKETILAVNLETGNVSEVEKPGGTESSNPVSIMKTAKPFKVFKDFEASGLPLPMGFRNGDRENLLKVIIDKKGNRQLRYALTGMLYDAKDKDALRKIVAKTTESEIREYAESLTSGKGNMN